MAKVISSATGTHDLENRTIGAARNIGAMPPPMIDENSRPI